MGIPLYFKSLIARRIANAIVYRDNFPLISSLSFDLNGIIYEAKKAIVGDSGDLPPGRTLIETEQMIFKKVTDILMLVINNLDTNYTLKTLTITIDGSTPGAKSQQQRSRRENAVKDLKEVTGFDRNSITPGTRFMLGLDDWILEFIRENRDHFPQTVIYSGHLVPGEGEHKIAQFFRENAINATTVPEGTDLSSLESLLKNESSPIEGHIIYGLDADLIMISLLSPINNIYLCREDEKQLINIEAIKEFIKQNSSSPTAIDDFVVIMFLLGNDFLPHIFSLERMADTIDLLLNIYQKNNLMLTGLDEQGNSVINWTDLNVFLEILASLEPSLLQNLSIKNFTGLVQPPSEILSRSFVNNQVNLGTFYNMWYSNALGPRGSESIVSTLEKLINFPDAPKITISNVSPEEISRKSLDMGYDYLKTMAWTYLYYKQGTAAVSQDWSYRYYHAPMLLDIKAALQLILDGSFEPIADYGASSTIITFTALHQLVSVLPLKSRLLLPRELQPLMGIDSIIRDLYPDKVVVEIESRVIEEKDRGRFPIKVTYDKEIPIIPLIDRQRIYDAVSLIPFGINELSRWLPQDFKAFTRSNEKEKILTDDRIVRSRNVRPFIDRHPEKFRGGQSYQGSRGGQFYQGSRGGQPYQGSRGGQGYQGSREGQPYQGSRGRQGYQGSRGGQGYQGSRGGQPYQGSRGGQPYQGSRGGQPYQGSREGQPYQGSRGGQSYQGSRGGQPPYQGSRGGQPPYQESREPPKKEYRQVSPSIQQQPGEIIRFPSQIQPQVQVQGQGSIQAPIQTRPIQPNPEEIPWNQRQVSM